MEPYLLKRITRSTAYMTRQTYCTLPISMSLLAKVKPFQLISSRKKIIGLLIDQEARWPPCKTLSVTNNSDGPSDQVKGPLFFMNENARVTIPLDHLNQRPRGYLASQ